MHQILPLLPQICNAAPVTGVRVALSPVPKARASKECCSWHLQVNVLKAAGVSALYCTFFLHLLTASFPYLHLPSSFRASSLPTKIGLDKHTINFLKCVL